MSVATYIDNSREKGVVQAVVPAPREKWGHEKWGQVFDFDISTHSRKEKWGQVFDFDISTHSTENSVLK